MPLPLERLLEIARDGTEGELTPVERAEFDRFLRRARIRRSVGPLATESPETTAEPIRPDLVSRELSQPEPAPREPRPAATYPIRHGLRRRIVGFAAALMAGAAIGLISGPMVLRRPGTAERPMAWTAEGSLVTRAVRGGPGGPTAVAISSDLDGFATVVVLAPDRRPLVVPAAGGAPIRITPGGGPSETTLPPAADGATTALIVVTETPADSVVRYVLRGRDFAAADVDGLQAFLKRELRAKNYRSFAFTRMAITVPEVTP